MNGTGMNGTGMNGTGMNGAGIGVALKLAAGRVDVDPLTGVAEPDRVPAGASAAGLAALEIALMLRDSWQTQVVVATAGSADAEPMLRDALARGADHAIRIEVPYGHAAGWGHGAGMPGTPSALDTAAGLLANALAGCPVVLCGGASSDHSHRSGTGAVPALIAAHGGRAQALGLTRVEPGPEQGTVHAERRLDGGWRERLLVRAPMVLSIEGGTARPRRAALATVLASRNAEITVLSGAGAGPPDQEEGAMIVMPYRPRARVLPAPGGETPLDRVMSLLGTGTHRGQTERVQAEPPAAAKRIVDQLRRWGYL
ncbi:MAG: mycofactocin-associated electron transfer flavoprotein beta subunit [Micromonosporaceae bacterium]